MATDERSCKVLFDFSGEDVENQLSISKGEIISVIGDVMDGNWIWARNNDGEEGFIPDQYFEEMAMSGGRGPKPPMPPPPQPKAKSRATVSSTAQGGGSMTDGSSGLQREVTESYITTSKGTLKPAAHVLGKEDTYNQFAYQLEWATLALCFCGSVFSFMYGTTQPQWYRHCIFGFVALILTTVLLWITAMKRESFNCISGNSALGRMIFYLAMAALLGGCYPVGLVGAIPALICAFVEYLVYKHNCQSVTLDNWRNDIFGGCGNYTSHQLCVAMVVLLVNLFAFVWGFIDGYNRAQAWTNSFKGYDIRPSAFGTATGFGRVITINILLTLLWASKGVIVRRVQSSEANRSDNDGCCAKLLHYWADTDKRRFIHRILGYSIVVAAFLHSVSNYYAYEHSGATRTYIDLFGYETIGTGIVALALLAVVIGGGSELIEKQFPQLFHRSHCQIGFLLIFLLFWHGCNGLSSRFWIFIIVPLFIYTIDIFLRWVAGDI